tara:strand:- start:458 stop:1363 length:906 start_codon:yes stop_codon:yes gene_type:complete
MSDDIDTEETEIILEVEGDDSSNEVVVVEEPVKKVVEEPDELETYSKNVQGRIKKLTEKYRQEERDKSEAVRLSQELIQENKKLKSRVQNLDTGYLSEYSNRLLSDETSARQMYKSAHEMGDADKMLEAQELISKLAVEKQRYSSAKARADNERVQVQKAQSPTPQQPQTQPQQQAPARVPDPRAQSWADKNEWFGNDKILTTAAFTIHQDLIENEGFDPMTDEYYTEIDSRMRSEFPQKLGDDRAKAKKTGGGSQVASANSSASRSTKQGRRTVKLSHSQVAIAKKLGVPLEEYAKYVKD